MCCFSAKHAALKGKTKTGLIGIRIIRPSGATCFLADCCYTNPTKRIDQAHSKPHHHLIKIINSLLPWYSWKGGTKQQSLTLFLKKKFNIRIVEYSTDKYIHWFYVTMVVI